MPKRLRRDSHAIMHVTLRRVVSQHAVDDDTDFSVREPPVWSKASFGLDGRGGHEEEGHYANDQSEESFDPGGN
jgi:hypothetical protein